MGRRRRRLLRVVRRTLPKIFTCPKCGSGSVRVTMKSNELAMVACGTCQLSGDYNISTKSEQVDIYNKFVDNFSSGE